MKNCTHGFASYRECTECLMHEIRGLEQALVYHREVRTERNQLRTQIVELERRALELVLAEGRKDARRITRAREELERYIYGS